MIEDLAVQKEKTFRDLPLLWVCEVQHVVAGRVPKGERVCVSELALALPDRRLQAIWNFLEQSETVVSVYNSAEQRHCHGLEVRSVLEKAHQLNALPCCYRVLCQEISDRFLVADVFFVP